MKKLFLFIVLISFMHPQFLLAQNKEIDSLKNLITTNVQDTIKLQALTDLSWYFSDKDSKLAKKYAFDELKLANSIANNKWIASSFNDIGIYHYKLGALDSALFYYNKSLLIRKTLNNKSLIASSVSKIGLVYQELGQYDKALEYQFQTLKIFEELGNDQYIAMTLNNIGQVYSKIKNYDKEMEYCEKAIAIHLKNKNEYLAAICYANLAGSYKMKGDLKKSTDYQEKALTIFKKYDDKSNAAGVLNGIGLNYRMDNKIKEALNYYHQAYELAKEVDDKLGLALYSHNISAANTALGNYNEAEKYSLEALKNADAKNKSQLVLTYRQLATIYAYMNNGKKSEFYLDKYVDIKDSMFSQESSSQVANMEVKYQTAEKDKALIVKDAEIIKQQADASKKATQRNAFLIGFLLVIVLAFYIFKGYKQKQKANVEITKQKEIIETKNKEITDSIHYAKRIQRALLASDKILKSNLPEHFIFYKPKDIVSGDFYWASETVDEKGEKSFLITAADCTGHGVPGAFMSLLGISYLNEITIEKKITQPDLILNNLRANIIKAFKGDGEHETTKDGMDMILCRFNFKKMKLDFASANNPVWIIKANTQQLQVYNPDKFPVGSHQDEIKPFALQTVDLEKGDTIFTITDGFADQFGGEKGKKYKYKQLKDFLISIQHKTMDEQKNALEIEFKKWIGSLEQVDDVLIIGIRV